MNKRVYAFLFATIAGLAACGGGGGAGAVTPGGAGGPTATPVPTLAPNTMGFAIPDGTIGTVNTPPYGVVGGYTQHTYSQVVAFPPGTTITLKNLSSTTPHTVNVLSTSAFPAGPALSTAAAGGSTLAAGYQSGSIAPGGTMTVTLATAGTYYIGCAYHYNDAVSMRDVILVSSSATPGPQATPASSGGSGGTCTGYYC
jgi:plastocyanin